MRPGEAESQGSEAEPRWSFRRPTMAQSVPAMSLNPGTTLGPFEIVALLGAGGVFRARDTRLHRRNYGHAVVWSFAAWMKKTGVV